MRITCVIWGLGPGGAERVLTTLARSWSAGHDVSIITLADVPDFYDAGPAVQRRRLSLAPPTRAGRVTRQLQLLGQLRRAIRRQRPDVVVSFLDKTNVQTILASWRAPWRVVVSERSDPLVQPLSRSWRRLRRLVYPRADLLVVQTAAVREWALEFLSAERVAVIANPVEAGPPWRGGHDIVAAGRLGPEKGFDVLIRSFAAVAAAHPDVGLTVFGEGPERSRLGSLAEAKGVRGRVRLPGVTDRLRHELAGARLFVLSSRSEGFPNVLLEALASGVPVVATDCPHGPRELLEDGRHGRLVPAGDVDALARALDAALADPADHPRPDVDAVLARYGADVVAQRWLDRFADVAWTEESGPDR